MTTRKAKLVYLVVDDFGTFGRAYVETDERETSRETVIHNMVTGQYVSPFRVVAFEEKACDVSADIARAVADEAWSEGIELPEDVLMFCEDNGVDVPQIIRK